MRHFILLSLIFFYAASAMATEEPSYTLIEQSGQFELRAYQPMIIAETVVEGSMKEAGNKGFRVIADYIFGNNRIDSGGNQEIAMTAPVTMQTHSETIDMTAPVTITQDDGKWRMHFVMPSQYSMATLPKPNNEAVRLRKVPATRYAVIRFSGWTGADKVVEKTQALLRWMDNKGLQAHGEPELARYNPPWTLPFLRRNEVMVRYSPKADLLSI